MKRRMMMLPPFSPSRATRLTIAGLLSLASAACADLGVDPQPQPQEQLLFVSTRGDTRQAAWSDLQKDVYRMNADGTGVENLTRQPAGIYRSLSLSPDGRKVAFNSDRSGCNDLWVMNTDGTTPLQLTGLRGFSEERCNFLPRWSPDGSRISFLSTRARNWGSYVMNADGSNPLYLSAPLQHDTTGVWPVGWTPDGRVVLQAAKAGAPVQTYVVKADGTGLAPLLAPGDDSPAWSPDGSRMAFISNRDGTPRLHLSRADGSDVRKLSNLSGVDVFAPLWGYLENGHSPWSPDGTRIAFMNFAGQTSAIYVVNADGSGLRRLTDPALDARFNGWSPSGTRIAFTGTTAGVKDVYVINADGTGLVNLTPGASHESDALWLPAR